MRYCDTGTISDLTLCINEAIDELVAPVAHADGSIASAISQLNLLIDWTGKPVAHASGSLNNAVSTYNELAYYYIEIITKIFGQFDGGNVTFQYDYDRVEMILTTLRCINNSTQAAWGMATMVSNGRSYDTRFPPGATTEISIPNGQSQRLEVFINPDNGKLDGVEYRLMWPYP